MVLPIKGNCHETLHPIRKEMTQRSNLKNTFLLLQSTITICRLTQAASKKDWLSWTARFPGGEGESPGILTSCKKGHDADDWMLGPLHLLIVLQWAGCWPMLMLKMTTRITIMWLIVMMVEGAALSQMMGELKSESFSRRCSLDCCRCFFSLIVVAVSSPWLLSLSIRTECLPGNVLNRSLFYQTRANQKTDGNWDKTQGKLCRSL